MDPETEIIAARADKHAEIWPSLDAMMACENCRKVFAYGWPCPFCGSEALWNIANLLSGDREAVGVGKGGNSG